jgi:hypothetical protein
MRMTLLRNAFYVASMTIALVSVANASSVRTFVSGTGNDANAGANCPRTAPCRSLATALTVTTSGGEIYTLDPAGYGGLTITGPITIVGVQGSAIAVATGSTGITINAGATDKINISGFVISGAGASSTTGIALNTGLLVLDNSTVKGLTTGLTVTSTHADVINSNFVGNTTGIATTGVGVPFSSIGGGITSGYFPQNSCPCATLVRIQGGSSIDNTTAFTEINPTAALSTPSATIWVFGTSHNATGFTNLLTTSGTGASNALTNPQSYVLPLTNGGGTVPN